MARSNKYVCIHGHFYQPPRENAWLEVVEQQESARPYHDWNERIDFECYEPNAAARIMDNAGWITKIRNNYNRISWNFGPTLLSWLEHADPEVYKLLQKADRRSAELFGGHGSAMAQGHSHLIMPLANYRDKITQVWWGVRDFEYRFGRYPEGLWLPEMAADTETLEVLAAQGIAFTVLAPRQAKAIRKTGETAWREVNTDLLDTRRPYWCLLPSGRRIALFFYHGGIAQDVAFGGLLDNGKAYAERLVSTFDDDDVPQIVHVATDGESYGHHHRYGEMALAACLNHLEDNKLATLTNYGQYLELFPPQYEVQIHENSSWSCVHGVERWRSDCGCNSGSHPGWHQRWRAPLRDTLNWLRDRLVPLYEQEGARLLRDPWAARNDYIEVMLRRDDAAIAAFLKKHARRPLSALEEVTVLRLLQIQRYAVLMFTSCGWFFDEISGIETNQILQYALRAMDYAQDVGKLELHAEFVRRLSAAPSNTYSNGAASYLKNVVPTRVDLARVAMHFAVASVFEERPEDLDLFNYTAKPEFLDVIEAGAQRLAAGRLIIRSDLTHFERSFSFTALYLGQQHLIGNISDTMNATTFEEMYDKTAQAFRAANLGELIGILQQYFGPGKFSLSSLFTDEKIKIIRDITDQSLEVAELSFRDVYNDNYQLMTGLQEAGLAIPDAWRNVAAYVLNADLLRFFGKDNANGLANLRRVAADLKRWNVKLSDEEAVRHAASKRIHEELVHIWHTDVPLSRVQRLGEMLGLVLDMGLKPRLSRSQNIFFLITKGYRKDEWVFINEPWKKAFERLAELLKVRLKWEGKK